MFDPLRKGIKAFFNGQDTHAFYTTTAGRLAYSQAPNSWGSVYAVYSLFGFVPDDTFDAGIEEGACHFNCYAATAGAADTMANACRQMFDGQTVTVTGCEPAYFSREMQNPAIETGPNENNIWLSAIEFNVRIQRQ